MISRKAMGLILSFSFLTMFILISGCRTSKPSGPTIPISILLSAPEQVEIEGRRYVLETSLWRDFMPICPPDGHPLIALIRITAIDSLEFPSSLDADRLWVIKERDAWETEFSGDGIPGRPYDLGRVARDGPKWGPGVLVDVVVRLVDVENKAYLLKASNQRIGSTY